MAPDGEPTPAPVARRTDVGTAALVVIAVLLTAAAVTYLGPILKPFLIGVFLFFVTRPLAAALIGRGCPPWLAYLLLSLAAAAGLFGAGLFLTAEVQTFRADWPRYEDGLVKLVGKQTGEAGKPLRELIQLSSRDVYHFLFEAGVGVTEVLIMTFFYLLFLILGADKLAARVRRALPPDRAEQAVSVGQQIETGMEQFMKVKTLVSAGMGAVTALLCYVFGLDHWLLWGFLFFVGNYITYIGSIAACGPPIVLAYLDLESPVAATVLAVLIVVNRIAWIDYVEIKMSGKSLNIDSILLFLWLAYWGWAWGVLGLILAFPMITSLKIVLEHLEGTRSWAVLMSED